MTGPATKAARSARESLFNPVRLDADHLRFVVARALAAAVVETQTRVPDMYEMITSLSTPHPGNGSAISSSLQMLWSHSRGLLRAVDLEQVGVVHEYGISAVLVKHPVAATLGSLKKARLREPPFGPCTAPGTAGATGAARASKPVDPPVRASGAAPERPTVARSSLSTGSSPQKSPIKSDDAIIRLLAAVRNRRGKRMWLRPKREAHRAHPGGKERILGRSRAEPLTPAPLSLSVTDRNASSTEAHKRIRPSGSQR